MWCAIIVNKQMKNHHRTFTLCATRKSKNSVKLLKNFQRNFSFFFSSLTRSQCLPHLLSKHSSKDFHLQRGFIYEKISLQPWRIRFLSCAIASIVIAYSVRGGKFQRLNNIWRWSFYDLSDKTENKSESWEIFTRKIKKLQFLKKKKMRKSFFLLCI